MQKNEDFSRYAMKQIKRSGNHFQAVDFELELAKEIDVQSALSHHPNIVSLYEVIDDRDDEKLYLVMEYCANG